MLVEFSGLLPLSFCHTMSLTFLVINFTNLISQGDKGGKKEWLYCKKLLISSFFFFLGGVSNFSILNLFFRFVRVRSTVGLSV